MRVKCTCADPRLFTCYCLIRLVIRYALRSLLNAWVASFMCIFVLCLYIYIYILQENGGNKCIHKICPRVVNMYSSLSPVPTYTEHEADNLGSASFT